VSTSRRLPDAYTVTANSASHAVAGCTAHAAHATTEQLKDRFGSRFTLEDGSYWWRLTSTWALISWQPRGLPA
jgi:hypothetical protein